MTHILFALLIASVASIVIMACSDGKVSGSGSACANATQAFNAAPSDGTAQLVKQSCGME